MSNAAGSGSSEERAAYYAARQSWIEFQMKHIYPGEKDDGGIDAFVKKGRYSQYHRLLSEMAEAAQAYAIAKQHSAQHFEEGILREAMEVCEYVYWAFHNRFAPAPEKCNPYLVWHHIDYARDRITRGDIPFIDRTALEPATGQYLKLPFRCSRMDRILVDALVALETLKFGEEIFGPQKPISTVLASLGVAPNVHPAMHHPDVFKGWIRGASHNTLIFGGIAAVSFYLGSVDAGAPHWITKLSKWLSKSEWMLIGWAASIMLALILVVSFVATVKARRVQAVVRQTYRDVLNRMFDVYDELQSEGPVSASRVRDLAATASTSGVRWPPPLFAILDDILVRDGRV